MLEGARRPEDPFEEKGGSGEGMEAGYRGVWTLGGKAGDALVEGGAPWQRHTPLRGLQPRGDPGQSKDIPVDKPCQSRDSSRGCGR